MKRIGRAQVSSVETGTMALDGGAMFGNVPKVLWSREHPADDANRIKLALRCLLIEVDDRCILVDTGMGDKWSEKHREMFAISPAEGGLVGALSRLGKGVEDITDVILTHLHFDHAGGATVVDDSGSLQPTFPDAIHWVQEQNLKWASDPNIRERVSYAPENFQPLLDGVELRLLGGEVEIVKGAVRVALSHGHTRGLQMVWVGDPGEGGIVYAADLIPTASHVRPTYTMGYDIEPLTLIDEKTRVLHECIEGGFGVFLEHDPSRACVAITQDNGRLMAGESIDI